MQEVSPAGMDVSMDVSMPCVYGVPLLACSGHLRPQGVVQEADLAQGLPPSNTADLLAERAAGRP